MDQKNTIVKCNATTCLYNYKGICDQYVIDLDMYGHCKDYCECEKTEAPAQLKSDLEYDEKPVYVTHNETADRTIIRFKNGSYIELKPTEEKPKRGKRIKSNFIEDGNTSVICYWCDFFNSEKKKCKKHHPLPEVNQTCPYIQSTGANQ